eukprot:336237-Alexandrium_andersonii.AAC.1
MQEGHALPCCRWRSDPEPRRDGVGVHHEGAASVPGQVPGGFSEAPASGSVHLGERVAEVFRLRG